VFLDGVPVVPRVVDDRDLLIELRESFEPREYLVELWYPFTDGRPPRGRMSVELPQIAGAEWTKRMYYQLVLPGNEQLLAPPASLTSEMTWGWYGVRWGSRPRLNTGELESWMDTSLTADVPAGTNEYLFVCSSAHNTVQFRTARRSLIVLTASGIVLLAGLLWLYFPGVRRTWIVLLVICLFAYGAFSHPEAAVFAAQAAALGLGLAIAARLLHWTIVQRRIQRGVIHGTSVMPVDRSTTETQLRRTGGSSHGDTPTVPAASPVPTSDSNA
jgi:hypothetical protein